MSQWKNVGAIVALSITAALAGTGCLAENANDEAGNEPAVAAVDQESGQTGEATEACCAGGSWGDLASLAIAIPGFGFGGFGPFFSSIGGTFPTASCGLGVGLGVGVGGCGGGCGGCW